MKGMFFLGKGSLEVRDLGDAAPGPGEVRVRVRACGVCGTDVHIYHGEKGSAEVTPPVVLGHEFAGVVDQVGEGVSSLRVGDPVTIDPNIYCGKCHFCRIGKKQLCESLRAVGVNRNGGFAETCICPESQCLLLGPKVPFEHGAMAEPLACCIHGIDRAGIRVGDSVCVLGGGSIGLMMVQLAVLAGASAVVLSEPMERQRGIGLALGAAIAVDPTREDLGDRIRETLGTDGVDVVIECVGKLSVTKQAFDIAKRGAAVLLFSVPKPDAVYGLEMMQVFQKELTILGSFVNPDTHARAVALIDSGRIRLEPLITHRYPLDRVEDAIRMQMSGESVKVLVMP